MTGTRAAFGAALLLEFSSEMSGHLSQRDVLKSVSLPNAPRDFREEEGFQSQVSYSLNS